MLHRGASVVPPALKGLGDVECQNRIERLIRHDNVLVLPVKSHAANIPQDTLRSADSPSRRDFSIIKDAPDTDKVLQIVTTSSSDADEDHPIIRVDLHQSG